MHRNQMILSDSLCISLFCLLTLFSYLSPFPPFIYYPSLLYPSHFHHLFIIPIFLFLFLSGYLTPCLLLLTLRGISESQCTHKQWELSLLYYHLAERSKDIQRQFWQQSLLRFCLQRAMLKKKNVSLLQKEVKTQRNEMSRCITAYGKSPDDSALPHIFAFVLSFFIIFFGGGITQLG